MRSRKVGACSRGPAGWRPASDGREHAQREPYWVVDAAGRGRRVREGDESFWLPFIADSMLATPILFTLIRRGASVAELRLTRLSVS